MQIRRPSNFFLPVNLFLLAAASWMLPVDSTVAQNEWNRFRGPNGSGLSLSTKLPKDLSTEVMQWSSELPGTGTSSPVVWGELAFLTSYDRAAEKLIVSCVNVTTGKSQWQQPFDLPPYRVHRLNSYASSTPAVDKDHVYVSYATPEHTILLALDHQGQRKWERDLGSWVSQHGYGASPIVVDDRVILFQSQQKDQVPRGVEPGSSRIVAVSCENGSDVWSVELNATKACYSVPAVYSPEGGKPSLIGCNTGNGFFSIDIESGDLNWSEEPFRMRTVASVLLVDEVAIGSCGSGGGGNYLVAMQLNSNAKTKPAQKFQIPRANYVPSPIALGEQLLLFTDKGIARSFSLADGTLQWEERISQGFSGSPVAADGVVYVVDDSGTLMAIKADESKYELISKFSLGNPSSSTPAIAGDRLLVRTESKLFCFAAE